MVKFTIEAKDHLELKLIQFLDELKSEGLNYEIEKSSFEENQTELKQAFNDIGTKNTKTYTLEEADSILEEAITKYENRASS